MPALSTRMGVPSGMEPVAPVEPIQAPLAHFPPEPPTEPTGSGFMRCPLPPIFASNPDSLRQFYKKIKVPTARIYSQPLKGSS